MYHHDRRHRFTIGRLSALLLLIWAGGALANPEVSAKAKVEAEPDTLQARFDSLRETRSTRLFEITTLEADAQAAVGDDRVALRGRALDLRLRGTSTLVEMLALVEEMEDARKTRRRSARSSRPSFPRSNDRFSRTMQSSAPKSTSYKLRRQG